MAQTILIPVDVSIESLNTLKLALAQHKHERVNVVLMFSQRLSGSITDLLFYSPAKVIRTLLSDSYTDAINIIKNSFESSVQSLRIEVFHGLNTRSFLIFADANKVDLIYVPANYRLLTVSDGFDPLPFIKKANLPTKELSWNATDNFSDADELNQLFK